MRIQDLDLNNNLIKRSDGMGYNRTASYSRKEGISKGLLIGGQLLGVAGVSYMTGFLTQQLYRSAMLAPVTKFGENSTELSTPIRIPSYDEEGKEFSLKEYTEVTAEPGYYHDIFVEGLKKLPIIGEGIANLIENTQNTIRTDITKKYGPSYIAYFASGEAQNALYFYLYAGYPEDEAVAKALEYYNMLLAHQGFKSYVEKMVDYYISVPMATQKMAEIESGAVGSMVGATTFLTLSSLVFGNEIKSGFKKGYSGAKDLTKRLYDKVLTGGKKELEEIEEEL